MRKLRTLAVMLCGWVLALGCGGAETNEQIDDLPQTPQQLTEQEGGQATAREEVPPGEETGERVVRAQAGPYFYAQPWDNGKRLTVCASSLAVRDYPGGPAVCYLGDPQTFTIYSGGGTEWLQGHAWGNCNRDGYVQNGWFCY